MPRIEPFERYADDYDRWFEENRDKYILELEAIRSILPGLFPPATEKRKTPLPLMISFPLSYIKLAMCLLIIS